MRRSDNLVNQSFIILLLAMIIFMFLTVRAEKHEICNRCELRLIGVDGEVVLKTWKE